MRDPDPNGQRWALLSGGKDSVATAHVLAQQGRLAGCVFIDTGIACPDTCPFVQRLCSERGWDLRIVKATDFTRYKTTGPRTFDDAVRKYGFPKDLVGHRWAFGILKERAIMAAREELGSDVVFASGARRRESARRAKSIARGFRHNGGIVIENPIQEWTTLEVWTYLRAHDLPVSPAYNSLGRSGDCLCGAFSKRGEAAVIRKAYPDVAARIHRLETEVRGRFPYPQNRWGSKRSKGGFTALIGRTTLEGALCGMDCADHEPTSPKRDG